MAYDAEDTRRRIFEAAAAEFAEHGLAGARVDRIATAADANKQAIYLYYGNKEKLFAAVLRAKLEEIRVSVRLDPDAVAESAGQIFDWYQQHPELIRLLLWESLEGGGGLDEIERERRVGFREKVDHLLDGGVARHLPADARVHATQDLLFTIMGLIAWNFAVPRMCRVVLDEESDHAALARRRRTVVEAVRTLAAAPPP
ncbi:TetR family transcriptional regulator [Streptantibioticus cattleyicolor]|uniref:TetR family regulatory protein n=1 Tax=Streptantibioticus cattleyicolor (strain ATCC 35852 / DSM 46488 / JCM 4925 / NBRC 14057 / NRRL 8057) TaxID=1003195 RepID=F8JMN0_STREN|nr:TetR family transcriptional regulator [Streptantibioticus cattleyicolor]AEW98847.1 tetR family regulatory protein [Streptantibioticus cattleyicolor NRRL 8057 = DSM 46488]CCB72109.1 TetR family regulatory protein [Streptantibioticus cattleyicolor NRRL 8057 = DSM 46488]